MADRTRGRHRSSRPVNPYLSEWVLAQPSPQKEVLLQVFSGVPELECARKLHIPLSQVEEIARSAAQDGPAFAEDVYEMAYMSSADADEFYRKTGEGEGTYKFLSLRYPKREQPKAPESKARVAARAASAVAKPAPQTKHASTPARHRKAVAKVPKPVAPEEPEAVKRPRPDPNDPEVQRRREARRAARAQAALERERERRRER